MTTIDKRNDILDNDTLCLQRHVDLSKLNRRAGTTPLINPESSVLRVGKDALNGAVRTVHAPQNCRFVRRISRHACQALAQQTGL